MELCDAVRAENPTLMRRIVDLAATIVPAYGSVIGDLSRVREISRQRLTIWPSSWATWCSPASVRPPATTIWSTCLAISRRPGPGWTRCSAIPRATRPAWTIVLRCEDAYAELCEHAPPGPLPDFVADIGWLIEELRVSLFAQPLRTRVPVSEKRVMAASLPRLARNSINRWGRSGVTGRLGPCWIRTGSTRLNEDVVAKLKEHRPVLIHQLDGFVDAGQAGRLFSAHLLEQLDHQVLADVRPRPAARLPQPATGDGLRHQPVEVLCRPALCGSTGWWTSRARSSCCSAGPEPDVQWERMAAAVRRADRAVRRAADGQCARHPDGRAAHPAGHLDRPRHRHRPGPGYRSWIDRVEVPASFAGLLEFRLGQADRKAMGFAAHVPHYLAQASFPEATLTLDPLAELGHRARGAAGAAGEGLGRPTWPTSPRR